MLKMLRKLRQPKIGGSIDAIGATQVEGWAAEKGNARPLNVDLFVDDKRVASALANLHRPDLVEGGVNGGSHGFAIPIPNSVRDGHFHNVAVHVDGRVIGTREKVQISAHLTPETFEKDRPWVDFDHDDYTRELTDRTVDGRLPADMVEDMQFFRENGYVWLRNVIPADLIDKVHEDVETSWDVQPEHLLVVHNQMAAPDRIATQAGREGVRSMSMRYLDFHNFSDAASEIMMHPKVTSFIQAYLDSDVVAMQSLLFDNGTEQRSHQDFAFVHSLKPALLAGAWVALEDAHPDAGPLFYYPKSHHRVRKHVFENGTVLAEGDGPHVRAFEEYLQTECEQLQLQRTIFTPKKGDVLIWHSALVHGGSPRNDRSRTRKSIVSHYSTKEAYPFDRRHPTTEPIEIRKYGQTYYGLQHQGHQEGMFRL